MFFDRIKKATIVIPTELSNKKLLDNYTITSNIAMKYSFDELKKIILSKQKKIPQPWRLVSDRGVASLYGIGYDKKSDMLLLDHCDGPEIIDCLTGSSLATSIDALEQNKLDLLEAKGFGPLDGKIISMTTLQGGGLPIRTSDGWHLMEACFDWPHKEILLIHPGSTLFNWEESQYGDEFDRIWIDEQEVHSLRFYGFSFTGLSFVIATGSDFLVYTRDDKCKK